MGKWAPFPYAGKAYRYTEAALKKQWPRLHRGDCEPLPKDGAVLEAWRAFHAGDFGLALDRGIAAGPQGWNAANKAAVVYAGYLETLACRKFDILEQAMRRAEELAEAEPRNTNAHYLYAFAAGRYSQGISVTKALAQGLGSKIKDALLKTLALAPGHADAHIALGTWHAEIIGKVGAMIGGMTYGARRGEALTHYRRALELNAGSAIARIEYANGLVMLDGEKAMKAAEALYAEAAACEAADAMERLDVELARSELE